MPTSNTNINQPYYPTISNSAGNVTITSHQPHYSGGNITITSGNTSTSAVTLTGNNCIAIGSSATVTGNYSIAIGNSATTYSYNSWAPYEPSTYDLKKYLKSFVGRMKRDELEKLWTEVCMEHIKEK